MDFSPSALWLKITDSIVPQSQAESLVNQIYGVGGTASSGKPDPEIGNPQDLSLPAVYVRAKDAVASSINAVQNSFIKYAIIAVAVVIVAGILFGFLPALGKRFAR